MRKSRLNCNLKTMVTDWSTWHKMMGFIRPFFPTLDKLRDFFRFKSSPTTTTNKRCYQNLRNQSKLVSFTKLIWFNFKKEKYHDSLTSKSPNLAHYETYSLMQKTDTHLLLYTVANVYPFFCKTHFAGIQYVVIM